MEILEQKKKSERSLYQEGCDVGEHRTFQLPGGGLKCGDCGETLPTVFRTVTTPGFVTRERICPKCGKINTTAERVINVRDRKGFFSAPCE